MCPERITRQFRLIKQNIESATGFELGTYYIYWITYYYFPALSIYKTILEIKIGKIMFDNLIEIIIVNKKDVPNLISKDIFHFVNKHFFFNFISKNFSLKYCVFSTYIFLSGFQITLSKDHPSRKLYPIESPLIF